MQETWNDSKWAEAPRRATWQRSTEQAIQRAHASVVTQGSFYKNITEPRQIMPRCSIFGRWHNMRFLFLLVLLGGLYICHEDLNRLDDSLRSIEAIVGSDNGTNEAVFPEVA